MKLEQVYHKRRCFKKVYGSEVKLLLILMKGTIVKRILLIFVFCFSVISFAKTPRQGRVTILHTNDMHAQFTPLPATWIKRDVKPQIGGMVALEYFIRQAKTQFPNALLLDGGDICTGTLLSNIEYAGALNGGFVKMMNLIGYDAFTIGNHEFDNGQENLHKLIGLANFDVLSANLLVDGKQFAPKACEIYNVNGVRVGVIGLILSDLDHVAAKKNLAGIDVDDPAQTAQRYIDKIDPKTDLIILLTHEGDDNDMELAQQIKNADIIVGAHSHTRIEKPIVKNGVIIVQAGSKSRYLGRLTVDVAGDTVSSYAGELTPVWVDSVKAQNPEMKKLVDGFQSQITADYGRQIGALKTAWRKNNDVETNLGDYISDVMRLTAKTDIAFLNSGGIRKSLPAGPITKMDVMEILPFSNYVVSFKLTGQQLAQIMTRALQNNIFGDSGILQVSGLKCAYKVGDRTVKITGLTVNGEKVQPDNVYSAATVDFVLGGLEDYEFRDVVTTPQLLSDMVIEYIEAHPEVETSIEARIIKE